MKDQKPTLYLVCGKIAAGKSTLAQHLVQNLTSPPGGLLISEDQWLAALYKGEISTLEDYVRCSARLRDVMGPHVQALLQSGLSVVMDYPANTLKNRVWLRGIFEAADVSHELHFLDVPDDICKARLKQRNAEGEHDFQTSEAVFDVVTSYFVPPATEEGFRIIVHEG